MLLYSVKNRMIINNMNSDLFTTTILIKFAFTPFDDYLLAYSVLLSTSFAKYTLKKYQKVINKIIYKFCKYFEKTL